MIQQLDTNDTGTDSTDSDSSDSESESEAVVPPSTKPNFQYSVMGLKLTDIMDELGRECQR